MQVLTNAKSLGGLLTLGPCRPLFLFQLQFNLVRLGHPAFLQQSLIGTESAVGRSGVTQRFVQLHGQLSEVVALLQLRANTAVNATVTTYFLESMTKETRRLFLI